MSKSNVTVVPALTDLQGEWNSLQIELNGAAPISLPDIFPFMSVIELKRRIWLHKNGDPRWEPERVFVGVCRQDAVASSSSDSSNSSSSSGSEEEDKETKRPRLKPLEFYWEGDSPTVTDPLTAAASDPEPNPLLMDDAGNRKPVKPTQIGTLLLELNVNPAVDRIVAVTASSVASAVIRGETEIDPTLFEGFFQYYFPKLTTMAQLSGSDGTAAATDETKETFAVTVPYLEDRSGRIGMVQRALKAGVGGPGMTMTTVVRLRWLLPSLGPGGARVESLEKTFYGLTASPLIPFLRFFPAEGTGAPLLKLALHHDGTPILSDPVQLAQFLNSPAPNLKASVIVARIPLVAPSPTLSGTLLRRAEAIAGSPLTAHLFEDGTADVVLEVPVRGTTFVASVAASAQRALKHVMTAMGYPPEVTPILRDLFATYKWSHPTPEKASPLTPARLQARVAALTPFLTPVALEAGETALTAFQWKAVSNYESESAQSAFITRMILRAEKEGTAGRTPAEAFAFYKSEISRQFGVTDSQAATLLERAIEKREEVVAPGTGKGDALKAVPVHAVGAHVAVSGTHPDYTVEIHGASSLWELQRIVSVVGVVLGASPADLSLAPPSKAVSLLEKAVKQKEKVAGAAGAASTAQPEPEPAPVLIEEEDIDAGLVDIDMDGLMDELGFSMGGEIQEEAVAAVAEVASEEESTSDSEEEDEDVDEACRANPWTAGEAALKIPKDWYMARLKREDKVLFGYSVSRKAGERTAAYSKSCQHRDDRQPNIMTSAEYKRIQRCYDGRVRFVNLPPRTPEDLPLDPTYNPKKRKALPDDYFSTDPDTGMPMWSVYNYENKTTPGQIMHMMCAELWCERDNLPLLREEFEGTEGRGFTKPPRTCPFCAGRVIVSLERPAPGESVIVRLPKKGTGKIHSFIGTITHNRHPDGHPLPCCDTTPRMLKKYLQAAFDGTLEYGVDLAGDDGTTVTGGGDGGDGTTVFSDGGATAAPLTDYTKTLTGIRAQYILGVDKTLGAGKIGLVSADLDAFFGQNSVAAVVSQGIRQTFRDGTTLFVKLGVDSRTNAPGLNLFAGLAPLLGYQSAEEVQRAFLSMRAARAFESANYGTLLHEFAIREPPISGAPLEKTLVDFATEFKYPLVSEARPHVARVHRAWISYLAHIANTKEPKQLRHFEHLLATPGILSPRGLLLMVLEHSPNGDGKIRIVCPSFGIPPGTDFMDVPVAILWHDKRHDTWEPLILYNDSRFSGVRNAIFLFGERSADLEALPKTMRAQLAAWIRDWRTSSRGCGRGTPPPHVWTPDRDTGGLPRLRQLVGQAGVTALVRDRSNRLAGIVAGDGSIFVPCLDDGTLANNVPRIYEASMLPRTSLADYLKTYAKLSAAAPLLKPVRIVAHLSGVKEILGFQVAAGSYIPTQPEPLTKATALALQLPIQQIDVFPWERDALILRQPAPDGGSGGGGSHMMTVREESMSSLEEQINEAYQHLRLSLGKWFQTDKLGIPLRKSLINVVKLGLPLYERRKRMDLLLEPIVRTMVAAEEAADVAAEATGTRKPLSLLRRDCLTLPESACTRVGACHWSGEESRCLIHAPATSGVDPVRIFTARLSDELLRNPVARAELFDGSVPEVRPPRGIVRVGDELVMAIKPRDTGATIMERLGFAGAAELVFPEEMLRIDNTAEEVALAVGSATGGDATDGDATGVITNKGTAARLAEYSDTRLPATWTARGFVLPTPISTMTAEEARAAAFVSATGRKMADWSAAVQNVPIRGDKTTPFDWSLRDLYLIAQKLRMNILFIEAGRLRIWLRPQGSGALLGTILFWGPMQLILTNGKKWFFPDTELPVEVLQLMDAASPADPEAFLFATSTKAAGAAGAASVRR